MIRHISACSECGSTKCVGCLKKYETYKVLKCDYCDAEENTLYEYMGDQLCESCLIDLLVKLGDVKVIEE